MQGDMWLEEKQYVKDVLTKNGGDHYSKYGHKFRSRFSHTLRVLKWMERIREDVPGANWELAQLAAIFHDAGYGAMDNDNHAARSVTIFREYAISRGIEEEDRRLIEQIIAIHTQKFRLKDGSDLPPEAVLLLEADLLDEEGALRIAWDGMATGLSNPESFREAYDRTLKYWKQDNPMVTPRAEAFWKEKQDLVRSYVNQLARDLEEA